MNKIGKAFCVIVCIFMIIVGIKCILTNEAETSNTNEVNTYELISINPYTEIQEYGLFTTKERETKYVEYIYKTEKGLEVRTDYKSNLNIGDANKVVTEKAGIFTIYTYYVTLDKYNEMYGETIK